MSLIRWEHVALLAAAGAVSSSGAVLPAHAQTFKQIVDPARITRAHIGHVIGSPGAGRTYGNYDGSGKTHRFIADKSWHRILIMRDGEWFRSFNNDGNLGGAVLAPSDVDISAGGYVYIADRGNGRILAAHFNGEHITAAVGSFYTPHMAPVAVAWDGGSQPFSTENLYVLDRAQSRVTYWVASGSSWQQAWSYGSAGSGTGQFREPNGICVRHSASTPSGTSAFGYDFYVADSRNERVVWLRRDPGHSPPTWMGERTLPEGWDPAACTVDHFGIVYVADRKNSQIVSYTWNLDEITRYGSFGSGGTNLNTFLYPSAINVPFSRSVSGAWVGDGRIQTSEGLSDASGGVAHWLGVEVPSATASSSAWGPNVTFRTTGMAYNTVTVHSGHHTSGDQVYATVWNSVLLSPGWKVAQWDGTGPGGGYAPIGSYHFHVTATSAYGCQGQAWCDVTQSTQAVSWDGPGGCTCDNPGEICVPCESNVALLPDDLALSPGLPTRYRLGQVLTPYAGPLLRREGAASTGGFAGAAMTDAQAVASVRAHGIRALSVDIPAGDGSRDVIIRIYSVAGRLVKVLLDESVEPGSYVIGWDGTDSSGRPVQPGVYLASMTAGNFRGLQRLLVK
jgi:flagellar hook assembly protein FlgD